MNQQAVSPILMTGAAIPGTAVRVAGNARVHRLMMATSPGVALSVPAIFSVPIWPKVAPLVSILLVLTTIGLWWLSVSVRGALLVPDENGALSRSWMWQRGKTTRSYVYIAVYMAAYLYFFGALSISLQWLTLTRDWESFRFGLSYFAVGVITYVFFALMWARAGGPVDRALDRSVGLALVVTLSVLLPFGGSLWVIPGQIGKLYVGQAAPWAEQYALAQKAVADRYPDAVARNILVSREY